MVSKGQGCEADPGKALAWYQKAAEQGMPEAQLALGEQYLTGSGTDPDRDVARHWFELAAQQGNETAKRRLEDLTKSGANRPQPVKS